MLDTQKTPFLDYVKFHYYVKTINRERLKKVDDRTYPIDCTNVILMATPVAGGDLFGTEFCADSESGLKFDLRGRAYERRGRHYLLLEKSRGCEIAEIHFASDGNKQTIRRFRQIAVNLLCLSLKKLVKFVLEFLQT